MKIWKAALACGAFGLGAVTGAHPAAAQGTQFPDVPANHWAYQAVQDLADKGYVKGYPDGKFLGARDLTRYEFATVIDRMVQTINDLSAKVAAGTAPTTPTGTPVTQDDLNKVQALVDSFHTQLEAIQSQIGTVPAGVSLQDELDALRQDVLDNKAAIQKAQATADNSYGVGATRKFAISGYIQARAVMAESGSKTRYPQGGNNLSGAYNGNYGQGGTNESLEVRRARIKFTGTLTPNTKYGLQFDLSGAISPNGLAGSTTTNTQQQLTTREAYVAYTFGDGSSKYPTLTAGQFANPFGYELSSSTSNILTPERPLAFSENANVGLWDTQDYDKGFQIGYNTPHQLLFLPAGLKLSYTLFNGAGRQSENADRHLDSVYRMAYSTPDKVFNIGTSYYDGQVERARGAITTPTYASPKKRLFGLDTQVQLPSGPFVNAEYVGGIYEKRSYFNESGGTPSYGLVTDQYVKHNFVQGYYVQGGYTFGLTGNHPFTLAVNYDKFLRSHSAQNDGSNALSGGNAYNSSSSYDDVNFGYGALYNLDKATRLRLWYDRPISVAHAPGTPQPQRIGLLTGEVQVKF